MLHERKDHLTAQKVEVALVFQQMLSTAEAEVYLARNGVCASVIERVLFHPELRRCYAATLRGAFINQAA
jgi:hypothetical protein